MKKIIFVDVDGTLLTDDGAIPASAVQAITAARKNGHLVYLCTGRSKPEIFDNILSIGFDGVIGAGGGYCDIGNKNLFHKKVTDKQVRHAVDYFNEHDIAFYLESNSGLYASKTCVPTMKKLVKEVLGDQAESAEGPNQFMEALITDAESLYLSDVNKISFLGNDNIPFKDIKKEFEEEFEVLHCTVPMFGENSGELAVYGVNKAKAIDSLITHLQIDQKDTIAIGDGNNDLEMFEYCHIGVAMGNASLELMEAADHITKRHDEDGLAYAFEKLGLI